MLSLRSKIWELLQLSKVEEKNYKIKSAKESNLRNNELTSSWTHQLMNPPTRSQDYV